MENPIEITLKHPIPYGERTLSVLNLRRPKAGDFRQLENMNRPFAMILDLGAALADLSPGVLDRLDVEDMSQLAGVVGGFLGGFPGTGKT
jgi:hypothetical protein